MVRITNTLLTSVFLISCALYGQPSASGQEKLAAIEESLKSDIPHVLCLEENFATGGQPSVTAYAKLAASGFHSVLNLRTAQEDVNLKEEKNAVEKAGMRYINIPIVSTAPTSGQVTEFLAAVQDKSLQPIMIHCASANRVGALWMIYRVLGQGWPLEKALQEATRIGLTSSTLKRFAIDYIGSHTE